ncbi:MAG: single-stranded-DNA-specific exonuclease RecJ [Candidatus Humimicrobiaceae bacterium]
MQEIPENWTAKNQKESIAFFAPEISQVLRNEVLFFLLNNCYGSEEKIAEFLKTPEGTRFNEYLMLFLQLAANSSYDSSDKIIEFLKSQDGNLFFESIQKYSPSLISILLNSGYKKIHELSSILGLTDINFFGKDVVGFSEIFLKILLIRGIDTFEKINSYVQYPKGTDFNDPFDLPNMEPAVNMMLRSLANNEKILIFGDYDADGIISTVLMYGFLKKIGINALCNIPDRANDGYDINMKFVNKLKKSNPDVSLIICVDCGSNSCDVKENFYKVHKNLDFLVCDHHKISEKSYNTVTDNNRFVLINPQDPASEYNFKYLSGAGVTFKFIQAVVSRMKNKNDIFEKSYLTDMLDLVAISTIADLMPLTDENRMLVKKGLSTLKSTKNPGLASLLRSVLPDKINSGEDITTYDVGYIIAPRINAPGRLVDLDKNIMETDAACELNDNERLNDTEDNQKNLEFEVKEKSFNLLTYPNDKAFNSDEITVLVEEINRLNEKRKEDQAEMLESVLASKHYDLENIALKQKIFIEKSEKWSEGLLGIVASDLVKKYNIPVILFKEDKEKYKGSGRSIEDFDLFENLNSLNRYFDKFGGHKMACGLTIKAGSLLKDKNGRLHDSYEFFKKEMIKIAKKKLANHKIEKKYYYDMEIDFSELKPTFAKELRLMEPFGIGNTKPVFLIKNCFIKKVNFSKNAKHAILQIKNKGSYKKALYYNVSTQTGENLKGIQSDTPVSLICNIEENRYEKSTYSEGGSLQLLILDLFYKKDFN